MADQAVNIQATEPEVAKPIDEVVAEETKAEEPKAEEPKTEEPKTEEPKAEENGEAKTEEQKTRAQPESNQSKYDPSVLPITDDPQQIRVQVRTAASENSRSGWPTNFHTRSSSISETATFPRTNTCGS